MGWDEILRRHTITKDEARERFAKIKEMCPHDKNALLHEAMHILFCVDFGGEATREDIEAFREELTKDLLTER